MIEEIKYHQPTRRHLTTVLEVTDMEPMTTFVSMNMDELSAALKSVSNRFYVYVLLRPNGEPFYVGKGIGRRVLAHEMEARNTTRKTHKLNVIRSIHSRGERVGYALAHFCDEEIEAHVREADLIAKIGRRDLRRGPLTNQTFGGEGVVGLSPETIAKKAANLGGASDDPQRRVANEFFHSIAGNQDSVPLKPIGMRKLEHTVPHTQTRRPTERMAKTLVAAAIASEQLLRESVRLPRQFDIEGRIYVIENGVAKDMLKAEMIYVVPASKPEEEFFQLTDVGFKSIIRLLSRPRLEDLGVIEPRFN